MSNPMAFSSRPSYSAQQGPAMQDGATERWLKTIRQKMENASTQPRVHFQRSPRRPVDEEGTLRDFE
ncbi:hypothetical protein [Acetobacter sp.]|uniref:hypothetical protein n=1 Tax=Acetobacter sp. TaxID=440 RepID=UPI0039EBB04F